MSEQACWRLLRAGRIGRVGWNSAEGPEVLPVTYVIYEDQVVFRTSPYGPLAELRNPRPAVFEIDDFDVEARSGWSVTARGMSRTATRSDELLDLWAHYDPEPWAPGSRPLFIVIVPRVVSGRTVVAAGQ